jgi:hypothetical protein
VALGLGSAAFGRDDLPGLAAYLDEEAKQRALQGPPRCTCEGGSRINSQEEEPICTRCGKLPNYEPIAA